MNVASHPLMGAMSQIGPEHLLAILPAAGATGGGILGIPLGPLGIAGGGAIGAGIGRTGENVGRGALGMAPNKSIMEQLGIGQNLPLWARGMMDVGEQSVFGGLLEGVPAKLLGVPSRSIGSVQTGLGKMVNKAEGKLSAKALRKARERFAASQMTDVERAAIESERSQMGVQRTQSRLKARDIGPDVQAASEATTAVRQQAGAAKAGAVKDAAGEGVEVSLDEVAERVMDKQRELYGQIANPNRLRKQIRNLLASTIDKYTAGAIRLPRGSSRIVDSKGRPVPAPPIKFKADVADNMKKALGERLTTEFAGIERGATPKGGLMNMVQRTFKEVLEEKIPDLAALNKQTGAAIRESKQVESLAARQPGPTVSKLRETQATRAADASARQGIRKRPVEEGVRAAQREREAVATALNNFREQPFWDPHLYLSGGLRMTTPRVDLMAHGLQRALARPGVATTARYSPDAINFLLRALMAQSGPPPSFDDGSMPPDTLTNR
jgi:hypothetical protein